jgi:hypothetical protein
MKNKKLKLVAMFVIIMTMSFISELFPNLFGDFACKGNTLELVNNIYMYKGCQYGSFCHGPTLHYGFRHWVWFFMGLSLFIWGIVELIEEKKSN